MVCLTGKIDDRCGCPARRGVSRRAIVVRRGRAANAWFALHGNTLTYDALNRLVQVADPAGQTIAAYSYNALGYRISESYPQGGNGVPAGTVKYLYYSNNWQVLETRWNGTASTDVAHQYVWSQMYIDAMVLRDTYINGTIQPSQRIYYQHDANFNTTAIVGLVGATWEVTQRYIYTPYGVVTVLNADWTTASSQISLTQYLHQGGRLDPVTSLYDFRNRDYSPTLGNWIEQDPAGYVNGGNRYAADALGAARAIDPSGLDWSFSGNATFGLSLPLSEGVLSFEAGVKVSVGFGGKETNCGPHGKEWKGSFQGSFSLSLSGTLGANWQGKDDGVRYTAFLGAELTAFGSAAVGGGFDIAPRAGIDDWRAAGTIVVGASLRGGAKVGISYKSWWGTRYFIGIEAMAQGTGSFSWDYHAQGGAAGPALVGPIEGNLTAGVDVSLLFVNFEVSRAWHHKVGPLELSLAPLERAIESAAHGL